MKKLIAISVVFALVAGAAFAADVGAEVIGMTDVIKGSTAKSYYDDGSEKPNKAGAGDWPGGLKRTRVSASGENDDGTFGGWFRLEKYGAGEGIGTAGYAWWKPIEQFRFRLGVNPDGDFGLDGVTRWGFYQIAGDVGIPKENWAFGSSFYGGWGENGGLLTITPIEPLEINIGIPYSAGGEVGDVYMSSTVQIAYAIDGIGKFGLTYAGGVGHKEYVTGIGTDGIKKINEVNDPSTIFVYFGLTAIENLSIDIGFGYTMSYTGTYTDEYLFGKGPDGKPNSVPDVKVDAPIAFGLGAHYTAGDFGVKARVQGKLAGKLAGKLSADGGNAYKIPMNVIFDALPYYAVNESLTAYFDLGVDFTAKSANDYDKESDYAKVGFHVEPYLSIKSSWWAPNFYAGIRIATDGLKYKDGQANKDGTSAIDWSVPIGIVFAF